MSKETEKEIEHLEHRQQELQEALTVLEIEQAKKDLISWGRYYMPHRFTTKTQSQLHYYLNEKLVSLESADLAGPREWAKSTLATVVAPCMWICEMERYQRRFISIICNNQDAANDWTREIKTEFEQNELMLRDYGSLVSVPWRVGQLTFQNGAQIRASHLRGRVRGWMRMGFRPQIIICDDLEDYLDVAKEKQRKKNWQWFYTALVGGAANDCVFINIGNLIHHNMILARRIKDNKGVSFKALDAHDNSTWEEHKSTESLHEKRRVMGEAFFNQEYMGMPVTAGDIAKFLDLLLEDFSPYTRNDWEKFDEVWVGVDLAKSLTADADFTTFAIVGVNDLRGDMKEMQEYHVLDLFQGKVEIPKHVESLIEWIGDIKPTGYVVESIGFQEEVAVDIEE